MLHVVLHGLKPGVQRFRDLPVAVAGEVDAERLGVYECSYSARWLFWEARALRRVEVVDRTPPVITDTLQTAKDSPIRTALWSPVIRWLFPSAQ